MFQKYIILIFLGLFMMFLCSCIWLNPIIVILGGVIAIMYLGEAIYVRLHKDSNKETNTGCIIAILFIISLVVCICMGDNYIVFSYGGRRHIYEDCKLKESTECYNLCKFNCILFGCYDDCEECANRKEIEIITVKQQKKAKKREENLDFIQQRIDELEDVKRDIIRGENIDVEEYRFRYEVEDEIVETTIEEYKDYSFDPRGYR